MSVESATEFLQRMREDQEFRQIILREFERVFADSPFTLSQIVREHDYEFTPDEFRQAVCASSPAKDWAAAAAYFMMSQFGVF